MNQESTMTSTEATMFAESIIGKVDRIVDCLEGRTPDQITAKPPVKNANSLLVLAVHTMANVEEAVFEILHGQAVHRNRDAEFATSSGTAAEVKQRWDELKPKVRQAIEALNDAQLAAEYDDHRRGRNTGRGILLLTATHASEHVGHAELTRDWIESN
jgi:hypothetical protein